MNFENKLIPGVLIKRYKRFFIDIKVDEKIVTAHCPNTGSMMGLLQPGNKVWITKSNNPKRKLIYTLQIIEVEGHKVGVNTHITNKIFKEGLEKNFFNEIPKDVSILPETKFGKNTRFDFLIRKVKYKAFIEVKNVTLMRKKSTAEFPDSVTSRGLKHINSLISAKKKGFEIFIAFIIQREGMNKFSIAHDIDPMYSKLLTSSLKNKLNIICYDCKFSRKGIELNKKINVSING